MLHKKLSHQTSIIQNQIWHFKFIEVTSQTSKLFRRFLVEDDTNLTPDNRDVYRYDKWLELKQSGTSIENLIIERAKETGRKVNVLDSGCGQCIATDELLSNPKLKDSLGTCTGVSMNYFSNVAKVMEKHGDRFRYYYGKAQDVLENTSHQYDLILDICGAYLYSVDKIYLMKLYHRALQPGGRAEIVTGRGRIISIQNNWGSFLDNICSQHPKTFFRENRIRALTIKKPFRQFPLPEFNVANYSESSSYAAADSLSLADARNGNAVCPSSVEYEAIEPAAKRRRIS